jgi:hypothetical protein
MEREGTMRLLLWVRKGGRGVVCGNDLKGVAVLGEIRTTLTRVL